MANPLTVLFTAGHGVVVGKFFQPHRGHRFLIDTAVSRADRVTVMVVDGLDEDPAADLHAVWLRELHPDATVIVVRDIEVDDDSEAWARHAWESVHHETIDAVFTSEPYGAPWAAAIAELQGSPCGNEYVGRSYIDVSGTQIRADPAAYWRFIDAPVRAHYVRRVCIVGAESTGSTTLTRSLALAYETIWVPEYDRSADHVPTTSRQKAFVFSLFRLVPLKALPPESRVGKAAVTPVFAAHDEDVLEFLYGIQAGLGQIPKRFFSAIRSANLLVILAVAFLIG